MSTTMHSYTLKKSSNKVHIRRIPRKRRKHRKSDDFRSCQTGTTVTSHHLFNSKLTEQKSTPQKSE